MANYPYVNYQQGFPPQGGYPQQAGYQPQNMYLMPQQNGVPCRPVSSRAEAEACPVDFMGAPMYFPDMANDKIYMKRWNATKGATDFAEYVRSDAETPASEMSAIRGMLETLSGKIDALGGGKSE